MLTPPKQIRKIGKVIGGIGGRNKNCNSNSNNRRKSSKVSAAAVRPLDDIFETDTTESCLSSSDPESNTNNTIGRSQEDEWRFTSVAPTFLQEDEDDDDLEGRILYNGSKDRRRSRRSPVGQPQQKQLGPVKQDSWLYLSTFDIPTEDDISNVEDEDGKESISDDDESLDEGGIDELAPLPTTTKSNNLKSQETTRRSRLMREDSWLNMSTVSVGDALE